MLIITKSMELFMCSWKFVELNTNVLKFDAQHESINTLPNGISYVKLLYIHTVFFERSFDIQIICAHSAGNDAEEMYNGKDRSVRNNSIMVIFAIKRIMKFYSLFKDVPSTRYFNNMVQQKGRRYQSYKLYLQDKIFLFSINLFYVNKSKSVLEKQTRLNCTKLNSIVFFKPIITNFLSIYILTEFPNPIDLFTCFILLLEMNRKLLILTIKFQKPLLTITCICCCLMIESSFTPENKSISIRTFFDIIHWYERILFNINWNTIKGTCVFC
eukprot:284814725_5